MKEADFQNLLPGIREAGAYLRGKKKTATRVDRIDSESVAAIRAQLRLSRNAFSSAFGIGPAILRNWEQGRRQIEAARNRQGHAYPRTDRSRADQAKGVPTIARPLRLTPGDLKAVLARSA